MRFDVIDLRRELHRYPEVGFTEFRTASRVVEILQSLGYEVHYGAEVMTVDAMRGVPADEELNTAYQKALREGASPETLKQMKGGLTGVVASRHGASRADDCLSV